MSRTAKVLGDRALRAKLKEPGLHALGKNLYLRVDRLKADPSKTTASFVFRYMRDKKAHAMGLGSFSNVSLRTAHKWAAAALEDLQSGTDPLEARRQARSASEPVAPEP